MARKSKAWSKEVDERRVSLIKEGYSYREVATILSTEFEHKYTKHMIDNRSRKTNTTKADLGVLKAKYHLKLKNANSDELFPEDVYELDEELTFTPEKKRRIQEIYNEFNNGKAKKILSLSDLHAPFIDFRAVEIAIKDHIDADILVLNGDVFDGHTLGSYDKLKDFDLEVELKQVFTLLDVVTKKFEKVIWVGGNHDFGRFMRFVAKNFGQGMKKYVLKRLNPINYVAEKYDNVVVVPHDWVQLGECIFVHPSGYSSALMSTALKQTQYLQANAVDMLPNTKFNCLVQGHTHDLGEYYVNGVKVIEQGCTCHNMDYRFDKPSSRRWQQGYAVVHLNKNGEVEFNKTRNFII